MTKRTAFPRSSRCCLVALSGLLLVVAPAQAKKAADDGSEGERANSSKELPAPALFGRVSPSVVVVEGVRESEKTQGSGVVIGPGQIATNHHVVADGKGVQIRQGSRSWPATIEALSPDHDLALLRVENLDLPRVSTRPSTSLAVGERVYAVGAPQGLELSLSDGLVSGLGREKPDKSKRAKDKDTDNASAASFIQTTAPISPGSSGGGLFDAQGRLVGITTWGLKGGQNLNFAIPTEWVEKLRAPKAGAAPSKTAPSPYGLTQRPWSLKCAGETRAVWGVFKGGSEILHSENLPFNINFEGFNTETPSFLGTIMSHPKKGEVVLSDLNREAGFIRFTSEAEWETDEGVFVFGNAFVPFEVRTRKVDVEYYFSPENDGRFRLTIVKPFEFHGRVRVLAQSGICKSTPQARQTDEKAEARCKAGAIDACLTEGKALQRTNRVGALALYLKGCSQSDGRDETMHALAAEACNAAARLLDAMGDKARAEQLRKQAAELKAPKQ